MPPMPLLFITTVKDICTINTFEKLLNILFSEVYYWCFGFTTLLFSGTITDMSPYELLNLFPRWPLVFRSFLHPWCSNSRNFAMHDVLTRRSFFFTAVTSLAQIFERGWWTCDGGDEKEVRIRLMMLLNWVLKSLNIEDTIEIGFRRFWAQSGEEILFLLTFHGKVSAQPHTIVKQICFPNGNVLFLLIVFSVQELNV